MDVNISSVARELVHSSPNASVSYDYDEKPKVSTLFSQLDPLCTGSAEVHKVLQLWKTLGVPNPEQTLQSLSLNQEDTISLVDLTAALESSFLTEGNLENPVYIAALASYQSELKHVKQELENAVDEREKLRNDISEANVRSLLLAEEVDDRHMQLEKNNQTQLKFAQQNYQEQLRQAQSSLKEEYEACVKEALDQAQSYTSEVAKLRCEESNLKEKCHTLSKENARLEEECLSMATELEQMDKISGRQREELAQLRTERERVSELEQRLAACGSASLLDLERLSKDVAAENKELRDVNDELTCAVESLKTQLMLYESISSCEGAVLGERAFDESALPD